MIDKDKKRDMYIADCLMSIEEIINELYQYLGIEKVKDE